MAEIGLLVLLNECPALAWQWHLIIAGNIHGAESGGEAIAKTLDT